MDPFAADRATGVVAVAGPIHTRHTEFCGLWQALGVGMGSQFSLADLCATKRSSS